MSNDPNIVAPQGMSKYHEEALSLLTKYDADCIALAVVGGKLGTGFCVIFPANVYIPSVAPLARVLREVADAHESRLRSMVG